MKSIIIVFILSSLGLIIDCHAQCNLPTSDPGDILELEIANRSIAECFAPKIHQMATTNLSNSRNGRADLITSIFYDDQVITNNWESLDMFLDNDISDYVELRPHVYYSIIWTRDHWVISYAFYHPRDYSLAISPCCELDNHEHDLEAVIYVVNRNSHIINVNNV